MVQMIWDPDAGYIPVDAQGNYDAAADAAINAERASRGIDVRDPGMTYRPGVTTTRGATPGQPTTYSAGFNQIVDPLITLANMAKAPGAIGRETGNVGSAADAFIKSVQAAAQKMQVDPLAAALATQGLTPSYANEQADTVVEPVTSATPPTTGNQQTILADIMAAANAPAAAPGSEMVHAYYPPGSPRAGEYHSFMSAADAAFLNLVVGEAPGAATNGAAANGAPGATVSLDQSILDKVNAGTIIPTSDLAQIENATIREQAATQLARLLVAQHGNTQAAIQAISPIYQQYIDLPGMEALNFNDWATSANLDWARVPPLEATPAVNEPDPYKDAVEGGYGDISGDTAIGTFGDESGGMATVDADPANEDLFQYIAGYYALNPGNWTATLKAAADNMAATGINVGGLQFGKGEANAAYSQLMDWLYSPTGGNIGAISGSQAFADYAAGMGDPSQQGTGEITELEGGGLNLGGLYQFGSPESLRTFGAVYPGFTSLLPGYGTSPAVSGAFRSAQDPMNIQYLASQAMTPGMGVPTADEAKGAAAEWIRNVYAGNQDLMMGSNYANFLNQLSGVLQSEARSPGAPVNIGGTPLDEGVRSKMLGLFSDPASQVEAYMNPFYQATSGSPEVRRALMNQIQQAAQRYQYQHPSGAFLPWALETNVGGIQNILPSLQGLGA